MNDGERLALMQLEVDGPLWLPACLSPASVKVHVGGGVEKKSPQSEFCHFYDFDGFILTLTRWIHWCCWFVL